MLKLMIVDDSNIIRNRIERCNQHTLRFTVVASASNGLEAVELFRATKPDVVTMDLTMPKMNGVECIEALIAINPSVLILVISALSDKATGIDALEKGARGFVCKPFSDEVLIDALTEITDELYG
jgi:two-component system, chemotaxis family, chemotaxis protein CheY